MQPDCIMPIDTREPVSKVDLKIPGAKSRKFKVITKTVSHNEDELSSTVSSQVNWAIGYCAMVTEIKRTTNPPLNCVNNDRPRSNKCPCKIQTECTHYLKLFV